MCILVIGGDGQIGRAIVSHLNEHNHTAIGTTKRSNTSQLYLDLSDLHYDFLEGLKVSTVIICASITSLVKCEKNPEATNKINIDGVIRLFSYLADKCIFTIYISSSAVFDGKNKILSELDLTCPNTIYGYQKAEVEKFIQKSYSLSRLVAIMRPTKITTLKSEFFNQAFLDLNKNIPITMFQDYLFSPISMRYFKAAILKLVESKIPGIFHLSCDEDIAYYDFFKKISRTIGAREELVLPTSKLSLDNGPLLDQKFPSISLKTTAIQLGILPQRIDSVIEDFLNE